MRVGFIVLAALATVLVLAPAAMAFGGGGGRKGGGGGHAPGASSGVTASEPLAALAVGLGLLGARYLRRR